MGRKRTFLCKCGQPKRIGGNYCVACHAADMRERRKTHPLEGEARMKMNARSYLHVYLKRGKIQRQPCEVCGAKAQAHHDDYSKPLEVRWLCRPHHLKHHAEEAKILKLEVSTHSD